MSSKIHAELLLKLIFYFSTNNKIYLLKLNINTVIFKNQPNSFQSKIGLLFLGQYIYIYILMSGSIYIYIYIYIYI